MSSYPFPKSDLETMQRQACAYKANGEVICTGKQDPIQHILSDKNTLFGPPAAPKNMYVAQPARPQASSQTIEGFDNSASSYLPIPNITNLVKQAWK